MILGAATQANIALATVLVILGLIVGFLNVSAKETKDFMIGGAVLVIISALSGDELSVIPVVQGVFDALLLLFVPATAIVAIKEMWGIAKD